MYLVEIRDTFDQVTGMSNIISVIAVSRRRAIKAAKMRYEPYLEKYMPDKPKVNYIYRVVEKREVR